MAEYGGSTAAPVPHRKPVPPPPPKYSNARLKPLTPIHPDAQQRPAGTATPPMAGGQQPQMTHSRTRTSSSSIFPTGSPSNYATGPPPAAQHAIPNPAYQQYHLSTRRTLSNATQSTSTTGTSGGRTPARNVSNASTNNLRRSSSSRSGGYSPTSYVALMRKQKATVWCDRSQPEDPRIVAQQKAAKMRAAMEVVGGKGRAQTIGSTSQTGNSLMSKSKIRHHGRQAVVEMSPKALVGGVDSMPVRLSASEVGDDVNNGNGAGGYGSGGSGHRRNMSGTSAQQRWQQVQQQRPPRQSRLSSNHSPDDSSDGAPDSAFDPAETPVPAHFNHSGRNGSSAGGGDYFQHKEAGDGARVSGSSGSSSAEGRENSFGDVGQMTAAAGAAPASASASASREKSVQSTEELRRRGSVDDRAMTMTGVRLFVANPDLSD